MNLNMDLRNNDTKMGISMSELKLNDVQNEIEDFKACNSLGVVYNNPVFMANNDN